MSVSGSAEELSDHLSNCAKRPANSTWGFLVKKVPSRAWSKSQGFQPEARQLKCSPTKPLRNRRTEWCLDVCLSGDRVPSSYPAPLITSSLRILQCILIMFTVPQTPQRSLLPRPYAPNFVSSFEGLKLESTQDSLTVLKREKKRKHTKCSDCFKWLIINHPAR